LQQKIQIKLIFRLKTMYVSVCRVLMQADNADPDLHFEPRGLVAMKGRAEPMQVYFLTRAQNEEWGPTLAECAEHNDTIITTWVIQSREMSTSFYYNTLDIPTKILCITGSCKQRIYIHASWKFIDVGKRASRLLVLRNFSKWFLKNFSACQKVNDFAIVCLQFKNGNYICCLLIG